MRACVRHGLARLALLALAWLGLALAGCGNKGPLYLPDRAPPAKQQDVQKPAQPTDSQH